VGKTAVLGEQMQHCTFLPGLFSVGVVKTNKHKVFGITEITNI
jgi:hypothetical protein